MQTDLFLLLIVCHGIGPRLVFSIFVQLDSAQFLIFISEENITRLNKIKGLATHEAKL